MASHVTSGFQAVDELFNELPKTVSWTETDAKQLIDLYKRGKSLQFQENMVDTVFKLNKPFEENDDAIDNMLNWEAYRMDFESTNASYLKVKKDEITLQEDILSFMSRNLIGFAFVIMEMKQRLVEPCEVFHTYNGEREVLARINELAAVLQKAEDTDDESPASLRKKFYGAG